MNDTIHVEVQVVYLRVVIFHLVLQCLELLCFLHICRSNLQGLIIIITIKVYFIRILLSCLASFLLLFLFSVILIGIDF